MSLKKTKLIWFMVSLVILQKNWMQKRLRPGIELTGKKVRVYCLSQCFKSRISVLIMDIWRSLVEFLIHYCSCDHMHHEHTFPIAWIKTTCKYNLRKPKTALKHITILLIPWISLLWILAIWTSFFVYVLEHFSVTVVLKVILIPSWMEMALVLLLTSIKSWR